jgi:hypothetical protein
MLFLRFTLINIKIGSIKLAIFLLLFDDFGVEKRTLFSRQGLKKYINVNVKLWKLRDISVITLKFVRIMGEGIRIFKEKGSPVYLPD